MDESGCDIAKNEADIIIKEDNYEVVWRARLWGN